MERCPAFEQPESLELSCEELVSNIASLDPEFRTSCQGGSEPSCLIICDRFLACLESEGGCWVESELLFESCFQRCVEFDQLIEPLFSMSCEEMVESAELFFSEFVELCSPEQNCAESCDRALMCADREVGLCAEPIECLDSTRCDPEGGR